MSKEKKIMLQIETTQVMDATNYLSCSSCPLNHDCKKYSLACELIHNKTFFGANLLCIVERAETTAMRTQSECVKNKISNPLERAKTAYKDFLPALSNYLNAHYKYECETTDTYTKRCIILTLAESLDYWGLLQDFDFVFSHELEITREIMLQRFEYEIVKSEKEKVGEQNATTEN